MSTNTKEMPEKLLRVLEQGGFRKTNGVTVPTHFGNGLEIFGSPSMQIRLVKDRGQWSIQLGPSDLSGEWYDLEDVLSVAGSKEDTFSFDLGALAQTLSENFSKIRKIFENYAQRCDELKRAAETRSGELMNEIFPDFQDGNRTAEGSPKHRRTPNNVELLKAVQKQLGRQATRTEAERAVTAVINAVKVGVKKDKIVQIVGFGTFKVIERKARRAVNPKTLQQIRIPKSKTVKFVPSKELKSA